MKTIPALPKRTRGPDLQPWLHAATLCDSQGREWSVEELRQQCRRDYRAITLKKKPRMANHRWTEAERQWIMAAEPEAVQCRYSITATQALALQWRCRQAHRNQQT
jgi:hypothetical protein